MRPIFMAATALYAAFASAPVHAEANIATVELLLDACKIKQADLSEQDFSDMLSAGICIGMAHGISTILVARCMMARAGEIPYDKMMAEPYVSVEETKQAFVEWALQNADQLTLPASVGMAVALWESYPCNPDTN